MPVVTGNLREAGAGKLLELRAELYFLLSGPTTSLDGEVIITQKVKADVDWTTGDFTVDLATTEGMSPIRWYTGLVIRHDRFGAGPRPDELPWKLFVPSEGGNFVDLLEYPRMSALVWVASTPEPNAARGSLWFNPTTQELQRWDGTMYQLIANLKGDSGEVASAEVIAAAVTNALAAQIEGKGFPVFVEGFGGGLRFTDGSGKNMWMGAANTGHADWIAQVEIINVTHVCAGPVQPPVYPGNFVVWTVTDLTGVPTGESFTVHG